MIQFTITIETDNQLLSAKTQNTRLDPTSSRSEIELGVLVNRKLGELLEEITHQSAMNGTYMEAPPELFDSMEQAVKANLMEHQEGGRS